MELWRDHVGDILTWQGAVAGAEFDWSKQYQPCPTLATPSFLCTMYYYVYVRMYVRTMQHTVAILFLNCVLIAIQSCFLYRVCTHAHTCIERFCAPLPPSLHPLHTQVQYELKQGNRLARPTLCPQEIYKIMVPCWNPKPLARPSFDELRQSLRKVQWYMFS